MSHLNVMQDLHTHTGIIEAESENHAGYNMNELSHWLDWLLIFQYTLSHHHMHMAVKRGTGCVA